MGARPIGPVFDAKAFLAWMFKDQMLEALMRELCENRATDKAVRRTAEGRKVGGRRVRGTTRISAPTSTPVRSSTSMARRCAIRGRTTEQGGRRGETCGGHAFDHSGGTDRPPWQVGGFIMMMFRDSEMNSDPDNLEDLAATLLANAEGNAKHHIGYEIIVEPLREFFGRHGCFGIMVKPLGYGSARRAV